MFGNVIEDQLVGLENLECIFMNRVGGMGNPTVRIAKGRIVIEPGCRHDQGDWDYKDGNKESPQIAGCSPARSYRTERAVHRSTPPVADGSERDGSMVSKGEGSFAWRPRTAFASFSTIRSTSAGG